MKIILLSLLCLCCFACSVNESQTDKADKTKKVKPAKPPEPREIFTFDVKYLPSVKVACKLYVLQAGKVEKCSSLVMLKSPYEAITVQEKKISIKILQDSNSGSSKYVLASSGFSRTGSSTTGKRYKIIKIKKRKKIFKEEALSVLPVKKEHIYYIEGDSRIQYKKGMSVEDFAKKNKGRYVLVTLRWSE